MHTKKLKSLIKEMGLDHYRNDRVLSEALESIQEEIRNSLWEKLDYIYENYGEKAAMEAYASLTEEEQALLEEVNVAPRPGTVIPKLSGSPGSGPGQFRIVGTQAERTPSWYERAREAQSQARQATSATPSPAPAAPAQQPTLTQRIASVARTGLNVAKDVIRNPGMGPAGIALAASRIPADGIGDKLVQYGKKIGADKILGIQSRGDDAPTSSSIPGVPANKQYTSATPSPETPAPAAAPANIELKLKTMSDRIEDENSRRAAGDPTNIRGRVDSKGVLRRGDIGNAIPTAQQIGDDRQAARERALAPPAPAAAPASGKNVLPANVTARANSRTAEYDPADGEDPRRPTIRKQPNYNDEISTAGRVGSYRSDPGDKQPATNAPPPAPAPAAPQVTTGPQSRIEKKGTGPQSRAFDGPTVKNQSIPDDGPTVEPEKRDLPAAAAKAITRQTSVGQELRDAGGNAAATSDTEAGRKKLEVMNKRNLEPDAFQKATKGDWSGFGQGGS